MGSVNPVFVRPEETFEILDEPGVGISCSTAICVA